MGASVEEATRHLNDAVGSLSGKGEHPGDHAELMIKAARTVEHGLLAAFAALPRDGTPGTGPPRSRCTGATPTSSTRCFGLRTGPGMQCFARCERLLSHRTRVLLTQ